MGLQISVHAVGDLAVSRVLDGYEYARKHNGKRDARHRIEHIEVISEADIDRMKALDVVASMQPRHAAFAGFFEAPLPNTVLYDDEYARAYAWQTLRDRGIPLAFSTDWPVVPVDVMTNIQSAVAPIDLGANWPDQSQTLMDTIDSYTAVNAWMAFQEHHHGCLRTGLAADLVMLDGNIATCVPNELRNLPIALTICDGTITFGGDEASGGVARSG